MQSIKPAIEELEKTFKKVAKHYKTGLKCPVITIQTKGRKDGVTGWFWADRWKNKKTNIAEINISAEYLKRDKDTIETLIHEIVHCHNFSEGVADCNAEQYHNKKFKERAEFYGLNVEQNGRRGFSTTTLTKELKKVIRGFKINYKAFELFRLDSMRMKKPTKMKKWSCGCTNIRCAVELDAKCNACQNEFQYVDKN